MSKFDNYVCAHTDFRFKALNKKRPKCPYCKREMNHIARRVWQGPINQYFHAMVELVCNNEDCPFRSLENWDDWNTEESKG